MFRLMPHLFCLIVFENTDIEITKQTDIYGRISTRILNLIHSTMKTVRPFNEYLDLIITLSLNSFIWHSCTYITALAYIYSAECHTSFGLGLPSYINGCQIICNLFIWIIKFNNLILLYSPLLCIFLLDASLAVLRVNMNKAIWIYPNEFII